MRISCEEFERATGEKIFPLAQDFLEKNNLEYNDLTTDETERVLSEIQRVLSSPLKLSGESRLPEWEAGWSQNLTSEVTPGSLIPGYMNKHPIMRWGGKFISAVSPNLEYLILSLLQLHLFEKWLANRSDIFEFGCGTGHNLLRARMANPTASLTGLDWTKASQEIIGRMNDSGVLLCKGRNFDFFKPDYSIDFPKGSAVYTFAALEQVGKNHKAFVKFLLDKEVDICLSIEPITELLDSSVEMEKLCIDYCQKRNYLDGYMTHLQELESSGQVEILEAKRNYIGSMFIEGYMQVVWRPRSKV